MKAILIFRNLTKKELKHIETLSKQPEIAIFSAVEEEIEMGISSLSFYKQYKFTGND
jgi:hypothetical protein